MKKYCFVLLLSALVMLSGCAYLPMIEDDIWPDMPRRAGVKNPATIGEIAYDYGNKNRDYTVFIEENGIPTAYLVLTDNYNDTGMTLLLRQELLPEEIAFNNKDTTLSDTVYEDSVVDEYLSKDFINAYSKEMQDTILESTITVTAVSSMLASASKKTTYDIKRKLFLLAHSEIGMREGYARFEGKYLYYFSSYERLRAYKKGQVTWWLLRTSKSDGNAWAVTDSGTCASAYNYPSGVRPAFCLNPAVPVTRSADVVPGEEVYVIDYEAAAHVIPALPEVPQPIRYNLVFSRNEESYGTILANNGLRPTGSDVCIIAESQKGYRFEGWYEGDVLLSVEKDYSFTAERDMEVEARFAVIDNAHHLTVVASEGGGISSNEGEYPPGEIIQVTASKHPGYDFVGWRSTGGIIEKVMTDSIYFTMPDHDVTVYADFRKIE
jgi:uncharacterized repeat protein (TIGR02543 family)